MAKSVKSRKYLIIGSVLLAIALMVFAFWPSATPVDIGTVTKGEMRVTIDEEGRTRVHDSYVISAPAAGRLERVSVEAGDTVTAGTVVARMRPTPLDPRAQAAADAGVVQAQAALRAARNQAGSVIADKALADSILAREERLWRLDSTSREALETARRDARAAGAAAGAGNAAIAARQAELVQARAQARGGSTAIAIRAPSSGRVLSVSQESAATLAAGAPIMEIGNVDGDLEVLVELLSTDAVQVSPGDKVIIEDWGGDTPLAGEIVRIEPKGFTKVSALGVEEQRVNTIVRFSGPRGEGKADLGSGFRVEARIVVWQSGNAIIVPSSALFRDQGDWAVFVVAGGGEAVLRKVKIGRNNGTQAQVIKGLAPDERVILYPASDITDGLSVEQREGG